jgi:hypothetical protein
MRQPNFSFVKFGGKVSEFGFRKRYKTTDGMSASEMVAR